MPTSSSMSDARRGALGTVADPVDLQRLLDDRARGHARVQRAERVLEDELHPAAQPAQLLRAGRPRTSMPSKVTVPGRRLDQPQDRARERRLAAAGLADDAERLAAADARSETPSTARSGGRRRRRAGELLRQLVDDEQCARLMLAGPPCARDAAPRREWHSASAPPSTIAAGSAGAARAAALRPARAQRAARLERAAGRQLREVRRRAVDRRQRAALQPVGRAARPAAARRE